MGLKSRGYGRGDTMIARKRTRQMYTSQDIWKVWAHEIGNRWTSAKGGFAQERRISPHLAPRSHMRREDGVLN